MSAMCKTPEELGKAINNREPTIMVVGDLKNKVIKIKIVGKAAWAVSAISLAAAIVLYSITPEATVVTAPAGGAGGAITFTGGIVATATAATTLGSAATTALAISLASGGVSVLNSLRARYEIAEKNNTYILLKQK